MIRRLLLATTLLPSLAWGQQRVTPGSINFPPFALTAPTAHNEATGTDGIVAAASTAFSSASATFTAADVGKTIIVNGAGAAGADLQTTISAVGGAHSVTLAAPSTFATPWWSAGRGNNTANTGVTVSYSVNDDLTLSGGTVPSGGVAAHFQIVGLGVNAPTIVFGGTGGASGACTVQGTTGVTRSNNNSTNTIGASYFTASGTVSGGAIGALTILQPGDYSTAPFAGAVSGLTRTVTFTNTSAVIGYTGTQLVAGTPMQLTTTGGLPTNFAVQTTYYVSATGLTASNFELATTATGTPIIAGSAGSGTQTATFVEPLTPISGCAGLTNAAISLKMAPHALKLTTPGHYTALPANPVSVTGGTGTGATVTLAGLSAGDQTGGYFAYGTDDTALINAAIAAVMTANGGTVVFPQGRSLVLGAIVIPYTGTAPPRQPPLHLTGAGQIGPQTVAGGYISAWSAGNVGSILDMRYAGTGTQVAKIDTRGMGFIQIDNLTLGDYGTDNYLFFQTTNTQPVIQQTTFLGNPTCYQMTCLQNAIRLGGITDLSTTLSTDVATDGFQANAPTASFNFFGHIQEGFQFGGSANSGLFMGNQADSTNGSYTSGFIHLYGAGFGASGNTFSGGEIELSGYPYGVVGTSITTGKNIGNQFVNLVGFDGSFSTSKGNGNPTLGMYSFDANSNYNAVGPAFIEDDISGTFLTQAGTVTNSLCATYARPSCLMANGLNVIGNVGVGTQTPTNALEVGNGTVGPTLRINGAAPGPGAGPLIELATAGTNCFYIGSLGTIVGSASTQGFLNSNCGGGWGFGVLNDPDITLGFHTVTFNQPTTAQASVAFGTSSTVPIHLSTAQTTAPALTSCGTGSPAIAGTDTAGLVTMGTSATGCVITFNVAYTTAPFCNVTWLATPLASQSYAVSTTAITLTQTSTSGNKVMYHCIAPSGG